ncbi:hypothetical protein SKAU_G00284810 [Synaphobranchus kaupii]|uniref:Uncharacterized protein n=1 Tax=Synaphobranchus kaupii TaxID=118154 RepID=A0A9Q1IPB2_SYNKA|nr:hypothetical protein SKAU_G00284810 [Synaphobranchus kaupii]
MAHRPWGQEQGATWSPHESRGGLTGGPHDRTKDMTKPGNGECKRQDKNRVPREETPDGKARRPSAGARDSTLAVTPAWAVQLRTAHRPWGQEQVRGPRSGTLAMGKQEPDVTQAVGSTLGMARRP